jgi:hypothetical protein
MITGIDEDYPETMAYAYTTATRRWRELPAMRSPRRNHSSICYHGEVYIIGGSDPDYPATLLNSVEKFNFDAQMWMEVASLPECMARCHPVVLNDELYVMGGARNYQQYSTNVYV